MFNPRSSRNLLSTVLLLGASFFCDAVFAQVREMRMRLDWVPSGIYAALYQAQQNGYYAREGLNVTILPGKGSNITMDGLAAGDIDIGFVSCWGLAVGVSKGRDLVSVATYTGKNGFAFIFGSDAGVKTLGDLSGKSIVVTPGSFETLLYPAVLASQGLPGNLMRQVNVDAAQKVPTFARGQADVVVTHNAYGVPLIQQQRQASSITWGSVGFVLPDYCLAVTRQQLAKEPQLVEKFLRASYASAKDAATNPSDAVAATIKLEPLLDRSITEKQWRLMTELFYSDDSKSCPHGWHSPSDWSKALETLKKYGGLEGSITDHGKFYTNQFFNCKR